MIDGEVVRLAISYNMKSRFFKATVGKHITKAYGELSADSDLFPRTFVVNSLNLKVTVNVDMKKKTFPLDING